MMHMNRSEVDCTPYGEMADLISCYQINHGMAEPKKVIDDEDMIPNLK